MDKMLAVIVSIICPPLGVALRVGWSSQVAVNFVLTLFAYLPGLIHALYHCVTETPCDAPTPPSS